MERVLSSGGGEAWSDTAVAPTAADVVGAHADAAVGATAAAVIAPLALDGVDPGATGGAAAPPDAPPCIPRTACRGIGAYALERIAGEGTYGIVSIGRCIATGERVAVKKLKLIVDREGFPITSLREISVLQSLSHANVVRLREVVTGPPSDANRQCGDVYMVFDASDGDLAGLLGPMHARTLPPPAHVRCYMAQLLRGLAYMHSRGWVHRDVKPANLLLSRGHELRIADLGLTKRWRPRLAMTTGVVTLFYRSPELLLGDKASGPPLDCWSAGVVFLDLLQREGFMHFDSEAAAVNAIWATCGAPTPVTWPGVDRLPMWAAFQPRKRHTPNLRQRFGKSCVGGVCVGRWGGGVGGWVMLCCAASLLTPTPPSQRPSPGPGPCGAPAHAVPGAAHHRGAGAAAPLLHLRGGRA